MRAAYTRVPNKVPLGTPSSNVVPFQRRRLSKDDAKASRIKYLRRICKDPAWPFEVRIRAALEAQCLETDRLLTASRMLGRV